MLHPINYDTNVVCAIPKNKNVKFKAKSSKSLVNVIEANNGLLSNEQLNNFIKENFGIIKRGRVKKLLSGLPEYLMSISAASTGLSVANRKLRKQNEDLQDREMFLAAIAAQNEQNIPKLTQDEVRNVKNR